MTSNFMIQTIVSMLAGFVGGIGAAWAQHWFAWRPQSRMELLRKAFDEAVSALAMYEADAYDPRLQEDRRRFIEFRKETGVQMQRARALVQAFFSEQAFIAFCEALDATDVASVPNSDFTAKRTRALQLMANYVGLAPKNPAE